MFEEFRERQHAANIDQSPPREMSLKEMEDLKQHYLDEMKSLSNDLQIKDYRNEKIDIDLLRACPHHGFTELHQLDTFYNGLNPSDQDSLNSATGGNLLERKPSRWGNVDSSEMANFVASAMTSAMTAMFKQHQVTPTPASVKAVEEFFVTCGGGHSYRQCPATTDGNTFLGYQYNIQGYVSAAAVNYNQGNTSYRSQNEANQFRPPGFAQPNVQNQGFNQNQGNNFNQGNTSYQAPIQQTQVATLRDLKKFKKTNEASPGS
ncbi:hypothetical protein Tco_0098899 [Tanacetum coccineum]